MNTRSTQKLSVIEKLGYSLGDLAANLVFQTLMTFLAFFYTDVFKLDAGTAATVIFVGGLIGACFNPVMGIIADRTQTRWGKFRPWILWTSIPFGLVAILTFSTPDLGDRAKVLYAFLTYVLLVLNYSANNLPYAALSGVLTGNMSDRNSLSAYRFVAVMIAQFIIQVLLLPLVLILGCGDRAVGFHNTMLLFSVLGTGFFLITFFTTKERVIPKPEQRSSIKQDLSDLLKNKPWIIMLLVTVFVFITLALKGGMYIYYFQHYVSQSHLAAFLQDIGFNALIIKLNTALTSLGVSKFHWPEDAATSAFSLFNAAGIISMIAGIGVSKRLADRYGKRDVFGYSLFLSALLLLAFYFFGPASVSLIFLCQILHAFFYGITIPLQWAMIADVTDYSEWRNNRRATAIVFSAMIFGLKAGLSIGGALVAGLLAEYGYQSGVSHQAPEVISGIRMAVSIYPAIPFLAAIACLFAYDINKSMELRIESELGRRRASIA